MIDVPVKCPFCGREADYEIEEWELDRTEDSEVECFHCGKEFTFDAELKVYVDRPGLCSGCCAYDSLSSVCIHEGSRCLKEESND